MNQARAAGESLAGVRFEAIYASPLLRAFTTAQAIHDGQAEPKPPLTPSPLLREQHWGEAEGQSWLLAQKPGLSLEEHFAQKIYPILHERWQKFPGGESLEDVVVRAEQAINEFVMPHVWKAAREGRKNVHIAIVSHGICISELIPVLVLKDESGQHPGHKYRGLRNTAWTRVTVDVKNSKEGVPMEFSNDDLPPLKVAVTEFDRGEHLDKVKRQKGGIGSAAYDPKQKDIRAFFGGGTLPEGRSESNAQDEVDVEINESDSRL